MSKSDVLGEVTVKRSRGVLNDLLEKIGGPNGQEWLVATKRFLRGENPWESWETPRIWPIWKIIQIGGLSKDQLLEELGSRSIDVDIWAKDMMDLPGFTTTASSRRIALARIQARDLGYEDGAWIWKLWERAQKVGLALCPAETGPHLRLANDGWLKGEECSISMEPLLRGDDPSIFVLGGSERLSLRGIFGNKFCPPEQHLIFRLPDSAA